MASKQTWVGAGQGCLWEPRKMPPLAAGPRAVPPGLASLCPTVPAPALCALFFLKGPSPSPPPSLSSAPHTGPWGGVYPSVVDPPSPGSPAALEPLHRGHWVIVLWLAGPPPFCSTCSLAVGQTGHVSSYPWDFAQAVPSGALILTSPTSGSCPSNIHQSQLCGEATSQVPQRWLPEPIP